MDAHKFFLDRFSDLYVHSPYLYIWRAAEAAAISKLIEKKHLSGNRILDMGCGDGVFSSVLFDKIFTGSDLSYPSLRKAASSGLYINNIQADATNLPFKNESFDMCFSNCVFEHILNDNRAFSETSRVLQRNSYLLITIANDDFVSMLPGYSFLKKFFPAFWRVLTKRIDRSLVHYHYYNISSLGKYLKELDLELIDCEPYLTLRPFRMFIILRTIEFKLRSMRLYKFHLILSKIFRNMIKSFSVSSSDHLGKHSGLAILCKKV